MKVAAIADLHCRVESEGEIRRLLEGVDEAADVLAMAGDLTNVGLVEEMEVLLSELEHFHIPKVAVTGNHDHENDQVDVLVSMMRSAGIQVLDANVWEWDGVEFVGTKGFCGGFGRWRLHPFGEAMLKAFIQVSVDEVVRLERALERLQGPRRVAILHYSPVVETLQGESPEIYPFLGYSLLADALDRHRVDMIVHGHAHNGTPEGLTPGGIPVRNVCWQVQTLYHHSAYTLFDV